MLNLPHSCQMTHIRLCACVWIQKTGNYRSSAEISHADASHLKALVEYHQQGQRTQVQYGLLLMKVLIFYGKIHLYQYWIIKCARKCLSCHHLRP